MKNNLQVLITLDKINQNKTKNYQDTIHQWKDLFDQIHVPIQIITPETNQELLNRLGVNKIKTVYGKQYQIIYAHIYLIDKEEIIFQQNRINHKALKNTYIKALKHQFKKYLKKIEKSVDIPNNLW